MNYQEWLEKVPEELRNDALWRVRAYQLALFVADLGWNDATKLMRDKRSYDLSSSREGESFTMTHQTIKPTQIGYYMITKVSIIPYDR